MTAQQVALILLATFSLACLIADALWSDMPTKPRLGGGEPGVVGFTLEEQIAALPGEVERMVRREVAG